MYRNVQSIHIELFNYYRAVRRKQYEKKYEKIDNSFFYHIKHALF